MAKTACDWAIWTQTDQTRPWLINLDPNRPKRTVIGQFGVLRGLPPCSEFYFCSRSLSVLAVSIYFPTLSLKKPQSAKFRAALRIYDLGAKYFRALSDRNDLEFFFEIWSGVFLKFNRFKTNIEWIDPGSILTRWESSLKSLILIENRRWFKVDRLGSKIDR